VCGLVVCVCVADNEVSCEVHGSTLDRREADPTGNVCSSGKCVFNGVGGGQARYRGGASSHGLLTAKPHTQQAQRKQLAAPPSAATAQSSIHARGQADCERPNGGMKTIYERARSSMACGPESSQRRTQEHSTTSAWWPPAARVQHDVQGRRTARVARR